MNDDQVISFKEEILYQVSQTEARLNSAQNDIREYINEKMDTFQKSYEKFSMQLLDVQTANVAERVKLEKIDQLEKFKENADESLYTLGNSIKNLQQDHNKACSRYDTIVIENLEVPGIIGDYCKFKNLRSYIEVNNI